MRSRTDALLVVPRDSASFGRLLRHPVCACASPLCRRRLSGRTLFRCLYSHTAHAHRLSGSQGYTAHTSCIQHIHYTAIQPDTLYIPIHSPSGLPVGQSSRPQSSFCSLKAAPRAPPLHFITSLLLRSTRK